MFVVAHSFDVAFRCAQTNTATNLIEPKVWPLLWMEWQEILHEVGHPHLARAVRGWLGSASGTERSHAIHGSASGTEQISYWRNEKNLVGDVRLNYNLVEVRISYAMQL